MAGALNCPSTSSLFNTLSLSRLLIKSPHSSAPSSSHAIDMASSSFAHLKPDMTLTTHFLLLTLALLAAVSASAAVRTDPDDAFSAELKKSSKESGGGGFFGPGGNFNMPNIGIPGFGNGIIGGGYGGGYGGPSGGISKGGTFRQTVICTEKGPCYKRKLTCPAKCFKSYSRSGKNYGGGGGGGGCTMDCKKKCVAYC